MSSSRVSSNNFTMICPKAPYIHPRTLCETIRLRQLLFRGFGVEGQSFGSSGFAAWGLGFGSFGLGISGYLGFGETTPPPLSWSVAEVLLKLNQ